MNAPGHCGSNGMSDALIGASLDELQAARRKLAPDIDTMRAPSLQQRACSGRRGGRDCEALAATARPFAPLHGAPAAVADSGRADRRRRPSNRSCRYKRATRSPQLLREPANGYPRRTARQEGQAGAPPSLFARSERRGRRGRSAAAAQTHSLMIIVCSRALPSPHP